MRRFARNAPSRGKQGKLTAETEATGAPTGDDGDMLVLTQRVSVNCKRRHSEAGSHARAVHQDADWPLAVVTGCCFSVQGSALSLAPPIGRWYSCEKNKIKQAVHKTAIDKDEAANTAVVRGTPLDIVACLPRAPLACACEPMYGWEGAVPCLPVTLSRPATAKPANQPNQPRPG